MKPNLALQERMLRLYQRFQQSNLTRAAFCREEGITAAQFTYWCRRFEQECDPSEVKTTTLTLAQVRTPIQAVKELVEREAFAANPVAEPTPPTIPGFTQLHLPAPATHSVCSTPVHSGCTTPVHSGCTTPAISTRPLLVLDMVGKGRVEFYTPVEASFLKALLS